MYTKNNHHHMVVYFISTRHLEQRYSKKVFCKTTSVTTTRIGVSTAIHEIFRYKANLMRQIYKSSTWFLTINTFLFELFTNNDNEYQTKSKCKKNIMHIWGHFCSVYAACLMFITFIYGTIALFQIMYVYIHCTYCICMRVLSKAK